MNKEKLLSFWRENKALILILIGSFLICLAYSFYFQIKPAVDARAYDVIAKNIVSGVGFREEPQKDILYDYAIARVGPLYQYFLAGIYKIFGHHYGVVWVFQALLHVLSAWLVYLTARLIFNGSENSKKIALIAAAFFGFYPDLIEISAMLLTETLYLFLFCLMLYVFFRFFGRDSNFSVVILGLVSGLATLARPPVLFLLPVILFYFFRRKDFLKMGLFVLMLVLVFTPWTARNYSAYDEIMPFGAAGQFNFWIGNYHGGNGEQEPQPVHYDYVKNHSILELQRESINQFKLFVFERPAEFLKITVLRVSKYCSLARPMGFWFYQHGLGLAIFVLSSALASVFLFVFGLAGLIKSLKLDNIKLRYLAVFAVITPLILFITVVETRYRFQIYPLLIIFAGYFFVQTKNFWRDKIFWGVAIILFLNSAIDFLSNLARVSGRLNNLF